MTAVPRIFVAFSLLLALPLLAMAQTPAPTEAQLLAQLAQLAQRTRQVTTLLDLAKLYYEQRRYDEAQSAVIRALSILQDERTAQAAQPTTLPSEVATRSEAPVHVGGDISGPRKLYDVAPVYPQIAQTANVQGTVIVEVTIAKDGTVKAAKILRSIALLDQAALDAVRQWIFTPTLLNGAPVAVVMTTAVRIPADQAATSVSNTPTARQPIRVDGNVREPMRLRQVAPVYPPEARRAQIAGVVILEVVIDTQGKVSEARVLRSIPALDQAAVEAVRQWEYTPTLLNGVPVPVVMTVTVTFTVT